MAVTEWNPGLWAMGLMTGTSLDGTIDVALLRTDGETILEHGPCGTFPYDPALRSRLREAVEAARRWNFDGPEPPLFAQAERDLTLAQAGAVASLLQRHALAPEQIGIIGFHGQTVLHRGPVPGSPGATRQLGDGALMARRTGIDTAFDFRSADVAAGGQGAPLAPLYHAALLHGLPPDEARRTVALNLGGVGNLTAYDAQGRLVAFDTGPANGPLNDWMARHAARTSMDRDGAAAARGRVDEARLRRALAHPYLARPYPKSLDRFDFTADLAEGLGVEDGAATLTALAAACVARGLDLLGTEAPGRRILVCGGGRRNPVLMRMLGERCAAAVLPAEAVGWRGDAIEAECFAFLAVRVRMGLPLGLPLTTGVERPLPGGRLAYAGAG